MTAGTFLKLNQGKKQPVGTFTCLRHVQLVCPNGKPDASIGIVDSDRVGGRQKEIQISRSDDMENAKESEEEKGECGREQEIPKFLSPEIRATVGIMDSESVGDRQKDTQTSKAGNEESTKESIEENGECAMEEEIPKILSPELHDVFSVFASMLDIKSFMKLAMTSKDMYKRCTEDKSIKINVDESDLIVRSVSDSPVFDVQSFTVPKEHIDGYLDALQKLPCRVNFRFVRFDMSEKLSFDILDATRRLTKELGVEEIDTIVLNHDFRKYGVVIAMITSFKVNEVQIDAKFPSEPAINMLEWNVNKLTDMSFTFSIDLLLEASSAIPHIFVFVFKNVEKDKFMQLIAKIQSGALRRVTVPKSVVDWGEYDKLPYDHVGSLPDERPLLFARKKRDVAEYWFLDWQGNVTKCVAHDFLDIYKCEPWELPWILREKKDIMKALFERHTRVSCTAKHFKEFASAFEQYAAPRQGELPNERPLFFKIDEHFFWLLLEDDTLMECTWKTGVATWTSFDSSDKHLVYHPTLTKFMFWKHIEKDIGEYKLFLVEGDAEYNSLFEDCTKLDFDYSGDLPGGSPVVFARAPTKDNSHRIVLIEGRAVQCTLNRHTVNIKPCALADLPPILVTDVAVKNILQKTLKAFMFRNVQCNVFGQATITISFEKYVEGFELFKSSPPVKRPLVYERVAENDEREKIDERWYSKDGIFTRKAVWKDGRLLLTPEKFERCPMEFTKMIFRKRVEDTVRNSVHLMFLDYDQFNECLEQFTIVPFDYDGPLTNDSPLVFMKKEIRHTCRKGRTRTTRCKCKNFSVFVWFLWEGRRTTYCSWGEKKSQEISFGGTFSCSDTPPALATKEHLKNILQGEFKKDFRYDWFGGLNDLRSLFAKRLPLNYNGPLPEERPLAFAGNLFSLCYLLREDGLVITGKLSEERDGKTFAMFSLPIRREFLPPALRTMSIKYAREFRKRCI